MQISREYLETQLADLTRQAEQAVATLHNANGAIAAVRHLLEVLDKEEPAPADCAVLPNGMQIAAD